MAWQKVELKPEFTAYHTRQLRKIVLETAERCRITQNGEVHAYGRMPNSTRTGWYLVGFDTNLIEQFLHTGRMAPDPAEPTFSEIQQACSKWMETLDRKSDASDAGYFEQNWRVIPNCKKHVRAVMGRR